MSISLTPAPASHSSISKALLTAFACYLLTSFGPVLGVVFGRHYIPTARPTAANGDLLDAFAAWDGQYYKEIVTSGYSYDPKRPSNVAFFPAYPLAAWSLTTTFHLRPELSLLVVSHISLATAFLLLIIYLRNRTPALSPEATGYTLLAFGVWPTTCFFRFAYSEAMFVCLVLLAFVLMQQRRSLLLIASVIGLATATRSVGVALLIPFLMHLWDRFPTRRRFLVRVLTLMPLACWGIIAFAAYQAAKFGEPLAFAQTQANWKMRPTATLTDKIIDLVALEPIWGVFDPASPCCWYKLDPKSHPLFSLQLANSVFFVTTIIMVSLGAWWRWLIRSEVVFCAVLLLIPYITRAHEMCLSGFGRFAATVFPIYLVLGQLLRRLPPSLAGAMVALSAVLLGMYAALFASWHRFF
jgi:hypothetical protein